MPHPLIFTPPTNISPTSYNLFLQVSLEEARAVLYSAEGRRRLAQLTEADVLYADCLAAQVAYLTERHASANVEVGTVLSHALVVVFSSLYSQTPSFPYLHTYTLHNIPSSTPPPSTTLPLPSSFLGRCLSARQGRWTSYAGEIPPI